MSPNDYALLLHAREASRSIGEIFKNGVADEISKELAILLLDEISNYAAETSDRLKHEMQLGMLEALVPEIVDRTRRQITSTLLDSFKTDTPAPTAPPAQ
jgi:hypothetical protein